MQLAQRLQALLEQHRQQLQPPAGVAGMSLDKSPIIADSSSSDSDRASSSLLSSFRLDTACHCLVVDPSRLQSAEDKEQHRAALALADSRAALHSHILAWFSSATGGGQQARLSQLT
jgi:hypothetical protein